jgi:hypothetical protein
MTYDTAFGAFIILIALLLAALWGPTLLRREAREGMAAGRSAGTASALLAYLERSA